MKTWLSWILLACVLAGGTLLLQSRVPCKQVIRYGLGGIDERFGISTGELIEALAASEEPWEKLAGRELFAYDPLGDYRVNLVFDERQERTQALAGIEDAGQTTQAAQERIAGEYDGLRREYEERSRRYEARLREFEERLGSYNRKVEMWNSRGGAPAAEYEELQDEKEALDQEGRELENVRQEVNALAGRLNKLAAREEQVVREYNSAVAAYEKRYGPGKAFDQGEYAGRDINIYQYGNATELRLVLAHELGHALGVGHVENPESLMYPLMAEQKEPLALTPEDQAAFHAYCTQGFSLAPESLTETWHFVRDRVQEYRSHVE